MSMGEDEDIFRVAMDGVVPLKEQQRQRSTKNERPSASQLQNRRNALNDKQDRSDPNYLTLGSVKQRHPDEVLEWKKNGVQPQVYKRLAAGRYEINGQIDLHRRTLREAREDIYKFLLRAQNQGWRVISIAHGRGENSVEPAKLKSYVAEWLLQIPEVIAFHSPPRHMGGVGAVLALLRKTPLQKESNRERFGQKAEIPKDLGT